MPRRWRVTTLTTVLLTGCATLLATGAVSSPWASAALAGPQIAAGQITSGYAGACLDDYQGNPAAGTPVEVFGCDQNFYSQLWTVEADGSIRLQGDHCIGYDSAHGQVKLYGCDTNATQKWLPRSNGTLANSGTGTCLYASSPAARSLGLVTCSTSSSPPAGQVWTEPAVTTARQIASAMVQLQLDYGNPASTPGLFCAISDTSAPGGNCWWWSANELRTVIDFLQRNGGIDGYNQYYSDIASTYNEGYYDHSSLQCGSKTWTLGAFQNDYFDDTAWWGLTWLDAYQLTGNTNYLETAEDIFGYIHDCGAQPAGTSCNAGGVIQYDKPGTIGASRARQVITRSFSSRVSSSGISTV